MTWRAMSACPCREGPHHLFPGKKLPENAADVFPDLKRGDLGSCALVAVADSMLGKKRGPEIDAHDTARGLLRTGTRPTLNIILLLRASV